jgi:hypothetical protein
VGIDGDGVPRRFASLAKAAPVEVQVRHGVRQNQPFEPLPAPTGRPPFRVELADVLGAAPVEAIRAGGQLTFHVAGDTGGTKDTYAQQIVASQLEKDLTLEGKTRPRFFYHVGDVVYYHGQTNQYYPQFYEPYRAYDAPFLPIPGNHDGSPDPGTTEPSLEGFVRNFCASWPHVTREAGDIDRDAMTLPNVYWTLRAPFATIVGLYTNVPEGGVVDEEQAAWLTEELRAAPPQAALIVALHHPVFSASSEHIGSTHLGEVLDAAAEKAGRLPDMVLTGHVHNYQRFTRRYKQREIPYLIAGAGGHSPLQRMAKHNGEELPPHWTVPSNHDVTLEHHVTRRHGYLRLAATASTLHGEYVAVPHADNSLPQGKPEVVDVFTLDLKSHRLSVVPA